jgi:hypothetical protein
LHFIESTQGIDPEQSKVGIVEDELDPADLNEELLSIAAELVEQEKLLAQRDRAVNLALTQKGIREEPCGSNRNPYSRYFGYGAQFWCADFISWAVDRVGKRDGKVPWGYPSNVANITRWGSARNVLVPQPYRGAIFTYRNGKHAGLVVAVRGRRFTTVEGNTRGPDGRVCWVHSHVRTNDGTYYFMHSPLKG